MLSGSNIPSARNAEVDPSNALEASDSLLGHVAAAVGGDLFFLLVVMGSVAMLFVALRMQGERAQAKLARWREEDADPRTPFEQRLAVKLDELQEGER